MEKIEEVIAFWFQGVDDSVKIKKKQEPFKLWFLSSPSFDEQIRERFEDDVLKAIRGDYREWQESPRGCLALIILLDQFTRNIYRGTPKMYDGDVFALALSLKCLQNGFDQKLDRIHRYFIYMPLMHAEDIRFQEFSVKCFQALALQAREQDPDNAAYYEGNIQWALKHCEDIRKFGRFPYRNKTLGRVSTPEEEDYLSQK